MSSFGNIYSKSISFSYVTKSAISKALLLKNLS